jgi:hypothetical protein
MPWYVVGSDGLRPGRHRLVGTVSWDRSIAHSNKWYQSPRSKNLKNYQSPWSENLKNLRGQMMTREPVNVLEVTRVVCEMEC